MNEEFKTSAIRVLTGYATEWRRFIGLLERGVGALEKLCALSDSKEPKSESAWHNASNELVACMVQGDIEVDDRAKKTTIVFQFTDPNGNFVMVDYVIQNEKQKEKLRELVAKSVDQKNYDFYDAVIEIVGELV